MMSPILPTVKTGCRRGTTPKLYWKNPRPMGMQGANPRDLRQTSWTVCNHDSGGFFTWSYKLVSPKENTGTSGVLKIHTKRITNIVRYLKSRMQVACGQEVISHETGHLYSLSITKHKKHLLEESVLVVQVILAIPYVLWCLVVYSLNIMSSMNT